MPKIISLKTTPSDFNVSWRTEFFFRQRALYKIYYVVYVPSSIYFASVTTTKFKSVKGETAILSSSDHFVCRK